MCGTTSKVGSAPNHRSSGLLENIEAHGKAEAQE